MTDQTWKAGAPYAELPPGGWLRTWPYLSVLPPLPHQQILPPPLNNAISVRVPMPLPSLVEGPERYREIDYVHYTDECHCCRFHEMLYHPEESTAFGHYMARLM